MARSDTAPAKCSRTTTCTGNPLSAAMGTRPPLHYTRPLSTVRRVVRRLLNRRYVTPHLVISVEGSIAVRTSKWTTTGCPRLTKCRGSHLRSRPEVATDDGDTHTLLLFTYDSVFCVHPRDRLSHKYRSRRPVNS